MTKQLWRLEFGEDYAVPAEIDALVESGKLVDASWHNDAMPSFSRGNNNETWVLWVDHPDQQSREFPENDYRYAVFYNVSEDATDLDNEVTLYQGNDIEHAITAVLMGRKVS